MSIAFVALWHLRTVGQTNPQALPTKSRPSGEPIVVGASRSAIGRRRRVDDDRGRQEQPRILRPGRAGTTASPRAVSFATDAAVQGSGAQRSDARGRPARIARNGNTLIERGSILIEINGRSSGNDRVGTPLISIR